jgi:hypothetical protein
MRQAVRRGVTVPIGSTVVAVVMLASAGRAAAQTPTAPPDATALAKTSQNPVGDLISLPFQFNFNTGGGLEDRTFFNLNFQPVMPIKVTPRINLIARTIVPVVSVPGPEGVRFSGVADIQQQLFFTPSSPGKVIWGVGPAFSLPTATADATKTGTWAGGFDAVVLAMPGPWVVGGLISQYWPMSDAGGEPETNQLVFQWFVNFNFGQGWALSTAPLNTANWDAEDGQQWTVPLGLGITKTAVFNGRPMSLGVQYYHNVKRPDGAAATQLRFVVSLLYPMAKK